jgi:hypothetical protein
LPAENVFGFQLVLRGQFLSAPESPSLSFLSEFQGLQPPLSTLYTGLFLVLEQSLHFFKLQVGDKVHSVSCLRLKACNTPDDTAVVVLPKRSRPPTTPKLPATDGAPHLRRVSFAWPPASSTLVKPTMKNTPTAQAHKLTPLPPLFHPSGHPAHTVKRP